MLSATEQLYLQLKQDIRAQVLPIGEALKQQALSSRYGVSRIPVRDVLQRLKNEGWLSPCGKCGVMISPLNAAEAEDLSLMRQYLEPLILAYAMPNLNKKVLGQAEDILEQLSTGDLSVAQHGELNWQFHACLYQPANRPTLFNTIANLHLKCSRYIGFHNGELAYNDTSQAEHYQLLEAIKVADTQGAQVILKQHISTASDILFRYLTENQSFIASS